MFSEEKQTAIERQSLPQILSFEVTDELIDRLSSFERGRPRTWGPTPLDPYHPDTQQQKKDVRDHVASMFKKTPKSITKRFATIMSEANEARLQHRLSRNHDNFSHREQLNLDETPALLEEMQLRVLTGEASPAEVIVVATQLGVPAYELSSLTHPYGLQIDEYLEVMREQNRAGIRFAGGVVFDTPAVNYAVKGCNYLYSGSTPSEDERSLFITRTTTIGQLDETTLCYERSSFVLRLTPELFEHIKDIPYDEDWRNTIQAIPGFEEYVTQLLHDNNYEMAVPSSTTAYVVNERLIKSRIKDEETYTERRRHFTREAERTGSIRTEEFNTNDSRISRALAAVAVASSDS